MFKRKSKVAPVAVQVPAPAYFPPMHLGVAPDGHILDDKWFYADHTVLLRGTSEERAAFQKQYEKNNPDDQIIVFDTTLIDPIQSELLLLNVERRFSKMEEQPTAHTYALAGFKRNTVFIDNQNFIDEDDAFFWKFVRIKRAAGFTVFLSMDPDEKLKFQNAQRSYFISQITLSTADDGTVRTGPFEEVPWLTDVYETDAF